HAAVELHGYLAYITLCAVTGRDYTIYGYKGKQVRDQIHCNDVARLFLEFFKKPRCGEVYNLGGGRPNSISVVETAGLLENMGYLLRYQYSPNHRIGDHICYISDLAKLQEHFPGWRCEYTISRILSEIVEEQLRRSREGRPV
ncbi:MAG: NAD-dependent epimerase, partial [Bryobacteraceae bacterium]